MKAGVRGLEGRTALDHGSERGAAITNKIARKPRVPETGEEARSLFEAGVGVHFHCGNREKE
jgi:hypothetical protein